MSRSICIAALLCAMIPAVGCGGGGDDAGAAGGDGPVHRVNLPPVPPMPLMEIPETHDDGSWSIMGILRNRDQHMGQTVTVSGLLQDVYECELAAAQRAEAERNARGRRGAPAEPPAPVAGCNYPHMFIADTMNSPRRIMLVDYQAEYYEPQMEPGLRYTVRGRYTTSSRGFTATEDGLIVVSSIRGASLVPYDEANPPE